MLGRLTCLHLLYNQTCNQLNKAGFSQQNKQIHTSLLPHPIKISIKELLFNPISSICMAFKEQGERFTMIPFSMGCACQSSVIVINNHPKEAQNKSSSTLEGRKDSRTKSSSSMLLQILRITKSLKLLYNLLSIYRKGDEEEEVTMEIGYPTDVQHVVHIGLDGFGSHGRMRSSPELIHLSSLSLKQLELAMASQAAECSGPLQGYEA